MLSLDSVAEELASWEDDTEMRIVTAGPNLVIFSGDSDGRGIRSNFTPWTARAQHHLEVFISLAGSIVFDVYHELEEVRVEPPAKGM